MDEKQKKEIRTKIIGLGILKYLRDTNENVHIHVAVEGGNLPPKKKLEGQL